MKKFLLMILVALMFTMVLAGCTNSLAEDLYLEEAPGIRITAEALKVLTAEAAEHTLSYSQRNS
jgi:type III secretory pathway lipoprotein EscJ